MTKTAGIVVIGDEILSGKFADENAAFLIGQLRELGVALRRIAVIPDDVDDIAVTVRTFSERFTHVFTSGGVGPTHDDVTIEGIAKAFGTEVVIEPQLAELVYNHWGPELGEKNIRLAAVPKGAELVGDDDPAWPSVKYGNVYILPGVPMYFRRKFIAMRERFRDTPYTLRRVYCAADEGTLAPHLDAIIAEHENTALGSYPRHDESGFYVQVTIESKSESAADAAASALCARLGELVIRTD